MLSLLLTHCEELIRVVLTTNLSIRVIFMITRPLPIDKGKLHHQQIIKNNPYQQPINESNRYHQPITKGNLYRQPIYKSNPSHRPISKGNLYHQPINEGSLTTKLLITIIFTINLSIWYPLQKPIDKTDQSLIFTTNWSIRIIFTSNWSIWIILTTIWSIRGFFAIKVTVRVILTLINKT